MNLKRFIVITISTWLMCLLFAAGFSEDTATPPETLPPVQTVQIIDLSPEQQADRIAELNAEMATTTSTSTSTVPATFTTVAPVSFDAKCSEWFQTAITVGWPNEPKILEKLGRLMFKESRCTPDIVSKSNDHGITQINYQAHHDWVESLFNMPFAEAMADPTLNLRFAYLLYEATEESGQCGFKPWRMTCD